MLIKKGFTLAEVMLTIGVLGIFVMLFIPILNNMMPPTNKIMLRKTYLALEKAVNIMISDNINYPAGEMGDSDITADIPTSIKVSRGFNYTDKIGNATTNKFCFYLANQLSLMNASTCPTTQPGVTKFATTEDKMDWYIYLPIASADSDPNHQFPLDLTKYSTKIIVDVNGAKMPNCFTDTGYATYVPSASYKACTDDKPDTFIIGVRYDGKLQIGSSASADTIAQDILSNPKDTVSN